MHPPPTNNEAVGEEIHGDDGIAAHGRGRMERQRLQGGPVKADGQRGAAGRHNKRHPGVLLPISLREGA